MPTKITPCLLFPGNAAQAARHYAGIFPKSKVIRSGPMGATFALEGQRFVALNGPPAEFTWAVSFMVVCKDQKEIDRLWRRLSAGGEPGKCGWLRDKFGVSWQIVPEILQKLLGDADDEKSERALQAMLGMGKLDIARLKRAHSGR